MAMKEEHIPGITESKLYDDVCAIIEDTRYRVAVYVNSEACRMNWHVGMRIKEDVLHNAGSADFSGGHKGMSRV